MTKKQVFQTIKNMERELSFIPVGRAREVSEMLKEIKEYIESNKK